MGKISCAEIGQDNTNPSLSSQTKRTLLWYVIKSINPERKQFKPASQVLELTKRFRDVGNARDVRARR